MRWSWKIGTFAGIDVFIHATFLLLIAWVGFNYWQQTGTLAGTLEGILFILFLFVCVVLHEFGHALAAGVSRSKPATSHFTRSVELPGWNVCQINQLKNCGWLWPVRGQHGYIRPLFGWLILSGAFSPLTGINVTGVGFIERLMVVNLSLALFNLLPAFPMDGGRVLRALLALRMEYTRATQAAASIGQGIAFLLGFWGLFSNPFLVFIALFVWIGAAQEASMVQMKTALGGIPVSRVTVTNFQSLTPQDRLSRAVELILTGTQTDFPVVDNGTVVGIVLRDDILSALSKNDPLVNIASLMRRDFEVADANEMLERHLSACRCADAIPCPSPAAESWSGY
jgi:Zn-dependent protease